MAKCFKNWIIYNFKDEDSPLGDLAADLIRDDAVRKATGKSPVYHGHNTNVLRNYLIKKGACSGCIYACDDAAIIYNNEKEQERRNNAIKKGYSTNNPEYVDKKFQFTQKELEYFVLDIVESVGGDVDSARQEVLLKLYPACKEAD